MRFRNIPVCFLVLIVLTISSCATLFNTKTKGIAITTTQPAKVFFGKDSVSTVKNRVIIDLPRQQQPIGITLMGDSISKTIFVKSKNSFCYWLNACPVPILGMGFLIDRKNPKRYTFPFKIYVDMADSSGNYCVFHSRDKKGQLFITTSLPWINSFYLKPNNENYKSNTGFWGIALGLDYYYKKLQFLGFEASSVLDFFIPFPAAVDFRGLDEQMSSHYIGLSNNYKVRNFSFGYGVSYASNRWDLRYFGERADTLSMNEQPRRRTSNEIGFIFPIHCQLNRSLYAGVIYRPTLFRFTRSAQFAYEHLISITVGWKIRLRKGM